MRVRLQDDEGAAVAEFAICLFVLIPTLLYGAFAVEAFMTGIKVQEAEISAGWQTTAALMHDFLDPASVPDRRAAAAGAAATRVREALEDFDSYRQLGADREMVVTRAVLQGLTCQPVANAGPRPFETNYGASNLLRPGGYIRCRASGRFSVTGPRRFSDGMMANGVELFSDDPYELFGLGSNVRGGGEDRGFRVLTDDWALEDDTENPVGTQENQRYYRVANTLYGGGPGAAAAGNAMGLIGLGDMASTSTFKMGYLVPVDQERAVPSGAVNPPSAHLTPFYGFRQSVDNYLGVNNPQFNEP